LLVTFLSSSVWGLLGPLPGILPSWWATPRFKGWEVPYSLPFGAHGIFPSLREAKGGNQGNYPFCKTLFLGDQEFYAPFFLTPFEKGSFYLWGYSPEGTNVFFTPFFSGAHRGFFGGFGAPRKNIFSPHFGGRPRWALGCLKSFVSSLSGV